MNIIYPHTLPEPAEPGCGPACVPPGRQLYL